MLLAVSGIVHDVTGVKVTVPDEELVRVTVVLPVVMGVLSGSCRCTVMVPDVTPATVLNTGVVNTSLVCKTLTVCVALVNPALDAVTVGVPAAVSV